MSKYNILFVGPLNDGSTCLARKNALIDLNKNVYVINTSLWLSSRFSIINSFIQRTYISYSVWKINYAIKNEINSKNINIVWVEKGEYIYPSTLLYIRKKKIFLINYNTDNIFYKKGHFWLHNLGIKNYNLYLSTNRLNIDMIKNTYNIPCFRVAMGYDKCFENFDYNRENKKYDVVFIGHWEPHTEESIYSLISNGIKVNVWGHNWKNSKYNFFKNVKPLAQVDYIETISLSKIALCFLSKWNKNESTGRTFEIPAIGTLLVAEYTYEHSFIFKDGVSAILFKNNEELVNKVKYILENEDERKLISKNGNNLVKTLDLSWQSNLKREWPSIINFYNSNEEIIHKFLWENYTNGELPPKF